MPNSKPQIILDASASHSLARLSQAPAPAPGKDTSVAEMLSQLHAVAGTLLHELKLTDAPIAKRLSMAKDMAKLLPLLATAERKVRKSIGSKEVEDMTDSELERARRALKARNTRTKGG